jgi:Family of unknown function (DUF5995)
MSNRNDRGAGGTREPGEGGVPGPAELGIDAPGVAAVHGRMLGLLAQLQAERDPLRFFLGTYGRTTAAVGEAIGQARFEDPAWVDRWDVAFAGRYLDALAAHRADPASAPRPWRLAFGAPAGLHPLQHVLLGINAHINYDLPQALLAVISDADFADARLMARRQRDHERIDGVLATRVAAEDAELERAEREAARSRSLQDRVLQPLNRAASRRFLGEARRKVWHNTGQLQAARAAGKTGYKKRLAELELLSAARITDLLAPGNVLLKLAAGGFGVTLPPA